MKNDKSLTIAFHSNQLGLRGTEVAIYDYAKYNEKYFGNKSIIISQKPSLSKWSHPLAVKKFQERFKVFFYDDFSEVENILDNENVDIFYAQKAGTNDGIISTGRKTVIHAVFQHHNPHGDVYAYISEWLGNKYKAPFVPYIVDLPNVKGNLRSSLKIPKTALVFGRHGGDKSFDIEFVHETIKELVHERDDIYFVFLNTHKFINHERVIFLDGDSSLDYKVKFINTCDAMLHARKSGETFGLAVAEFSFCNKPVITYSGPQRETAHLQMLGRKAITYESKDELTSIIQKFKKTSRNWNAYKKYSPQKVMRIFKKVFIDN